MDTLTTKLELLKAILESENSEFIRHNDWDLKTTRNWTN